MEAGKIAIAHIIARHEIMPDPLVPPKPDWYDMLLDKIAKRFEDIHRNQLSIITFNYDRSLEHFLFQAIKARFGKTDEEVANALSAIPIHHVYGQLSRLPWQRPFDDGSWSARSYGDQSPTDICNSAKGIKLIHEREEQGTLQPELDRLLTEAERIFILGFSFQTENMRWIQAATKRGGAVRATAFGMSPAEKYLVTATHRIEFYENNEYKAYEYLRHCGYFLGGL